MFGYSEHFADRDYSDPNVDYVVFTDDPELRSETWRPILIKDPTLDPSRLSKRYKHLPHVYLADYEESLYIDNTVKLKVDPSAIFRRLSSHKLAMLRHPHRDCLYKEAEAVISMSLDSPAIIAEQLNIYRQAGFPEKFGLNAGTFILRKHSDPAVIRAMTEWHSQILRFSKRDQLSWNFVAWLLDLRFTSIHEHLQDNSMFTWPVLDIPVRVPRDFDDDLYLSIHLDVRNVGINPRKHYLHFGHAEKRRYK
ncbi:hypothetical protein CYG48_12760 [Neorhizobium sp. SOG26]|uniref:glycosyltransferase domain-containing protein n=1 Tax=Neorhizobium sp. SOG26 TaxID=2060726 RepID=UPI000E5966C9|nr:glycosyltransferase domain-containing protein [Neorhizobium sp. SOG26]AXV16482.1 hypothetical protein CYG48_12760 [Neorhizobium sp. SOG26]